MAPGDYFGEVGLLTGEPLTGELTALTRAVIYEIPKAALSPLLKARPAMAEELSECLASRQLANRTRSLRSTLRKKRRTSTCL